MEVCSSSGRWVGRRTQAAPRTGEAFKLPCPVHPLPHNSCNPLSSIPRHHALPLLSSKREGRFWPWNSQSSGTISTARSWRSTPVPSLPASASPNRESFPTSLDFCLLPPVSLCGLSKNIWYECRSYTCSAHVRRVGRRLGPAAISKEPANFENSRTGGLVRRARWAQYLHLS